MESATALIVTTQDASINEAVKHSKGGFLHKKQT
jgi:hypothetical protein